MTFLSQNSSLRLREYRADSGMTGVLEHKRQVLAYFPDKASIWHSLDAVETRRIDIPRGAVAAALRNRRESIEWITSNTVFSVELDDQVLSDTAEALLGRSDAEITPNPHINDARLSGLLEVLQTEHQLGFPTGQLFVSSIEQAISSYLVGNFARSERDPVFARGGISPRIGRRIVEFVKAHLDTDLSIAALAGIAEMSPSHFSRSFRVTFGTTPHDFIIRMRMELAKDLLSRPDLTLLDVAQLSGFKTQQHFSRVFARFVGLAPGRFRNML